MDCSLGNFLGVLSLTTESDEFFHPCHGLSLTWLFWNEVDFFQDPLLALGLQSSNEQSPLTMVGF